MSFSDEQIKALEAKLDPVNVKAREQAGRQLHYIEGWHAIAEANRIFGFDAWDRQTVELRQLGEPYQTLMKERNGQPRMGRDGQPLMTWRVAYMARVRIKVRPYDANGVSLGEEIIRDGCGFGSGIDQDLGQAHESALKEAETDAMKRALMTFGNPFGLALYDKSRENVGTDDPPEERPAKQATRQARPTNGASDHGGAPESSSGNTPNPTRVANMTARIGQCETVEEVDALRQERGFARAFDTLISNEKSQIEQALDNRRKAILRTAAERVAGQPQNILAAG